MANISHYAYRWTVNSELNSLLMELEIKKLAFEVLTSSSCENCDNCDYNSLLYQGVVRVCWHSVVQSRRN